MLFIIYIYCVIKIILFKFSSVDIAVLWRQLHIVLENPDIVMKRMHAGNLTPFSSIKHNIHRLLSIRDFSNLIGNILIFIPNGIFISILTRYKLISSFILSFAFSLGLECSQAIFSIGVFDVDDIILNVSGGIAGYVAYQMIRWTVLLFK
ncbi:VanZ family protein [Paenibacillus sp. GCM10028914]|uniref:VanZ family protein n=1 Tax=Paenibacillus sp. GCM10028914 TaxID=3273416 RepID=UPI003620D165